MIVPYSMVINRKDYKLTHKCLFYSAAYLILSPLSWLKKNQWCAHFGSTYAKIGKITEKMSIAPVQG